MTDTSAEALLKLAEALDAWRGFVAEGYEVPAASTPMLQASTTLRALAAERATPPADVVERVARAIDPAPGVIYTRSGQSFARQQGTWAKGVATAALSALRPGDDVPAGVVVPKEPTEAMLKAGGRRADDFMSERGPYPRTKAVYRAMLSAAKGGEQ